MGLTDKLKDLQHQAEEAVVEHREQVESAIHTAGNLANEQTKGKYADKITKVSDKATEAVDKLQVEHSGEQGS